MNKGVKRAAIIPSDIVDEFIIEKKAHGINPDAYIGAYYKLLKDVNKSGFDITSNDINKWILCMQDNGNKPATINHYLSHARVFLYWCMAHEYMNQFKISLVKHQEEELKFFSDEELAELIIKPSKKCSFTEHRTWAIICFILSTGARASTIANIKKEDVDYKTYTIAYRHLKNKTVFYAPMTITLSKILKEYERTWCINSVYLFSDCSGNQLSVSAMRQALERYCIRRGIQPRGPHSLRHNFARAFIKNGGNAFALQKMLTHSDLTITKRYVRLFDNEIKNDVASYNALDSLV